MSLEQHIKEVAAEPQHLVRDHPWPSAATAFGFGLGVGFLAVSLLSSSSQHRDAAVTERFLNILSRVVPDSLSSRLS